MELKVELGSNRFVRIPGVIIAGEKNKVFFESSAYGLDKLEVVISNGEKKRTSVVKNKVVDITDFSHKAGVIEIAVALIQKNKVVKTWDLEPLVVREIDGVYEAIPELTYMRQEIALMKKIIKELNAKINETM